MLRWMKRRTSMNCSTKPREENEESETKWKSSEEYHATNLEPKLAESGQHGENRDLKQSGRVVQRESLHPAVRVGRMKSFYVSSNMYDSNFQESSSPTNSRCESESETLGKTDKGWTEQVEHVREKNEYVVDEYASDEERVHDEYSTVVMGSCSGDECSLVEIPLNAYELERCDATVRSETLTERDGSGRDSRDSGRNLWKFWRSENVVNRFAGRGEDVLGHSGPSMVRYKFPGHKRAAMREACKEVGRVFRRRGARNSW